HPDHLGSSSYISNLAGNVSQHIEYMPFGEMLVDEHINSFNTPFKFNGKEYDEETGNYYYGARYYDPKLSIFIGVDPLAEKTMSSYGYCYNNPIILTDPTGMQASPIYDFNGNYLGNDDQGFNGEIIFMDEVVFNNLGGRVGGDKSTDGSASASSISHDVALASGMTLNQVREDGYTQNEIDMVNNALTHVISFTDGVDFDPSNLLNGKTSAVFYKQNYQTDKTEYANANKAKNISSRALYDTSEGVPRITYNLIEFGGHDFTVENLQNTWFHEWDQHHINKVPGGHNSEHAKAIYNQSRHSSWINTTETYKKDLRKVYKGQTGKDLDK
ncbi:RHS repeat-associated core domain-containing protein, partial [Flavobacterium sp. ST-75]